MSGVAGETDLTGQEGLIDRWRGTLDAVAEAARRAGRDPRDVTLVAVSKLHPAAAVAALARVGQADFGESFAQEALAKQEALAGLPLRWHFIGRVQTNKAKVVAGGFHLVHAVDSHKLAQALHNQALRRGIVQPVLVQVNLAREEQKGGVGEEDLPALVEAIAGCPNLELQGLMTMPPFFDRPDPSRPLFARLRELRDGLRRRLGLALPHLSMGMSHDFEPAVSEGATLVRIGTRIFGPRPRE